MKSGGLRPRQLKLKELLLLECWTQFLTTVQRSLGIVQCTDKDGTTMNTLSVAMTIAMAITIEIDFIVVAARHIGRGRGGRSCIITENEKVAPSGFVRVQSEQNTMWSMK